MLQRVFLIPAVILLLGGIVSFSSSGRDDAYITYWPAHTLSDQGEVLNYNGERIEQSSSLLFVFLLALLRKMSGLDVETLGSLLSVVFAVSSVFATGRLASLIKPQAAFLSAWQMEQFCLI
jgi:hypothetical protein